MNMSDLKQDCYYHLVSTINDDMGLTTIAGKFIKVNENFFVFFIDSMDCNVHYDLSSWKISKLERV